MDFAKKLNSLMELSGTTNSQLARSLMVDASLVSRWRKGVRSPLNNFEVMKSLGKYFAAHLTLSYQREEERRMIGRFFEKAEKSLPHDEMLTLWLKGIREIEPEKSGTDIPAGLAVYTENVSLLLNITLHKKIPPVMWCLLDQPHDRARETLRLLTEILMKQSGLYGKHATVRLILRRDFPVFEIHQVLGRALALAIISPRDSSCCFIQDGPMIFEHITFAIENVAGLVSFGGSLDEAGVVSVYEDENLTNLIGEMNRLIHHPASYSVSLASIDAPHTAPDAAFPGVSYAASRYDALFLSNKDGIARHVRGDTMALWGLAKNEIIGRSTLDIEARGHFYPSITRLVMENSKNVWSIQTTKTGKKLLVIGMPIVNAAGETMCIVNLSNEVKDA